MGSMKDLSIEIDETIDTFERAARSHGHDRTSEAYDAFYDLLAILKHVLGEPLATPEPFHNQTYATRGEFDDLSAQIAALVASAAEVEVDPTEFEIQTGQTLHGTLGDGSFFEIPNVDEFHLVIDETGEWPVGWSHIGVPETGDVEIDRVAGYWTPDGEFHMWSLNYLRSSQRTGW